MMELHSSDGFGITNYRKSLNRSPRLLLVQLSQTPASIQGPDL